MTETPTSPSVDGKTLPTLSAMRTALGYMKASAESYQKDARTVSGSGEAAEIHQDAARCIAFAMAALTRPAPSSPALDPVTRMNALRKVERAIVDGRYLEARKLLNEAALIGQPVPSSSLDPVTVERCAKIADQVAINAERRAAGHAPQSQAQEAAYNKMEGAQEVAHQIRERALIGQPAPTDTGSKKP